MAKFNYFYDKVGEDVKEWLAKIDWILKANNVADRRRVAVAVSHLRDTVVDWFKVDKVNINWYTDNNPESFIRRIKAKFTSDTQKDQWYAELHQLRQVSG